MNAVCVYVSTAQLVLQADPTDANTFNEQRLGDLCQLFSQLRQLLSCAVCTRLLNDPYAPLNEARCQHNVCRLCVRGRKCLRPLCSSCKDLQDFKTYTENRQMRCLLLCYKSLCEHLLGSSFFVQLSRQKQLLAGGNDHMSTQEIVLEGARYEDILNCFSADLPHAVTPRLQLPPASSMAPASSMTPMAATQSIPLSVSAATPLAPQAVPHMRAHMQNAPKAATPPSNAASATSSYVIATPTPATAAVKQEHTSPSLPAAGAAQTTPVFAASTTTTSVAATSKAATPTPLQPHVQSMFMKHLKHNVDTSSSHSFTAAGLSGLPATPTITYVGHNTPGIVVPIVSSSVTTTAPLSIASSKLQSYNRQLAQARSSLGMQPGVVKTTALSSDTHASLPFKVASPVCSAATTATGTTGTSSGNGSTHTTATVTSQQIRNPPSIKTVSNGSAMYSVLYTGVGNKITIKRKTDGDEDSSQRKNAGTTTSAVPASGTPTFRQQVPATTAAATAAKLNPKRRGCRCGNATPTPGKLTCCGQRCPCYVESKSCIGCKCRGCRNPHRPDGGKVRPVIPELACYEIQMADESASLSPSELPVATTTILRTSSPVQQSTTTTATTVSAFSVDPQPQSSVVSQLNLTPTTSTASGAATLIPFINIQQHQQQPLESLQRESVLIQNAEGKYQVVNVFTTGPHSQHTTGMQRIHSISQLSANVTAANNSNHHNSGNTGHVTTVNMLSVSTAAPVTTTATSTNTMPQILLQQQQHHQRQHHQQQLQQQQTQLHHLQRIASGSGSNSTTTSISLQLQQQQQHHQRQLQQQVHQHQQQMKAHNIMAMRAPSSSNTQTQTMPLIAASGATSTTITLSPIIVTSPNTFTSDMFSDSESDEFLNHAHMLPISSATTRMVAVPPAQASPLSLSSGSGNSSSGSGSITGGGDMSMTMGGAHLAPAMVEVIEASDV